MHWDDTSDFRVHVPLINSKKILDIIRKKFSLNLKQGSTLHQKGAAFHPVQKHWVSAHPMYTV